MLPILIQRMDFLAIMYGLRKHLYQTVLRQILVNVKVRTQLEGCCTVSSTAKIARNSQACGLTGRGQPAP
jgi:hypothetical protein